MDFVLDETVLYDLTGIKQDKTAEVKKNTIQNLLFLNLKTLFFTLFNAKIYLIH